MRRIFGILVTAALVAPVGLAGQEPETRRPLGRPGMHAGHLLKLREQLDLTPQQVARIEAIHTEVEQENRPLMEKLRALRGDTTVAGRARSEMTEAQRRQHREMMKTEREKRGEMTEEQRKQRREMMKAQREKRSEVTEKQREERRERMEQVRPIMEAMRENHREAMEEVKEVLTDAQEAKLRALRESHARPRHEGRRPVKQGAQG